MTGFMLPLWVTCWKRYLRRPDRMYTAVDVPRGSVQ